LISIETKQEEEENSGKMQSILNIAGHEKGKEEHYSLLSFLNKDKINGCHY